MRVPLFIIIQAFHYYKKGIGKVDVSKILRRVVIPFVSVELITFILTILCIDFNSLIRYGIRLGGLDQALIFHGFMCRSRCYYISLLIFSLAALAYFDSYSVNDAPWSYTTGFRTHRWPCCFWVAYVLVSLLYFVWTYLKKSKFIEKIVKSIAISSFEIFLIQMSLIYLFHKEDLVF